MKKDKAQWDHTNAMGVGIGIILLTPLVTIAACAWFGWWGLLGLIATPIWVGLFAWSDYKENYE